MNPNSWSILFFGGNGIYLCMILAIGIYVGYLFFLLVLIMAWNSWSSLSSQNLELPLSVIVPFRNEEKMLPMLIDSLKAQSHTSFEVIFINDHSEDESLKVLDQALQDVPFDFQIHSLEAPFGKKEAITIGVALATHDLILTTDADCFATPNWLTEMSSPFNEQRLQMLVGPVGLVGESFWQKMQSIEFSSLIGTGGALLRLKAPVMANGANLAYRKDVFEAVSAFEGIEGTPSGDDELLMNKVSKKFPGSIRFQKSSKALVLTNALKDWAEFRQQRLRWASKWKVGFRPVTIFSALAVFVVQLIQVGLIVQAFTSHGNLGLIAALLLLKLLIEYIFLWSVRRSFGQKMDGLAFLVNYLLYPFYAIYFGIAANFGKFHWKGRRYKTSTK